jgi:Ca2+-binding EF-hand superfamily protein
MTKLVIGAVALSLCALAWADDKPRVAKTKLDKATFATLDRNGDNRISRTEAGVDRQLSDAFAYIDTDGDGFISLDEYLSYAHVTTDAT